MTTATYRPGWTPRQTAARMCPRCGPRLHERAGIGWLRWGAHALAGVATGGLWLGFAWRDWRRRQAAWRCLGCGQLAIAVPVAADSVTPSPAVRQPGPRFGAWGWARGAAAGIVLLFALGTLYWGWHLLTRLSATRPPAHSVRPVAGPGAKTTPPGPVETGSASVPTPPPSPEAGRDSAALDTLTRPREQKLAAAPAKPPPPPLLAAPAPRRPTATAPLYGYLQPGFPLCLSASALQQFQRAYTANQTRELKSLVGTHCVNTARLEGQPVVLRSKQKTAYEVQWPQAGQVQTYWVPPAALRPAP